MTDVNRIGDERLQFTKPLPNLYPAPQPNHRPGVPFAQRLDDERGAG